MYLRAAFQTHRILQGYIELDLIAHPEVCSVVVKHFIRTRVPMAMHETLKVEMTRVKASVKAGVKVSVATVEKLE
jgi:hypothetical protein